MIVYPREKPPQTMFLNASRAVHSGPALIVGFVISGSGADPDAQIYDGLNTNGRQIMDIRVLQNLGHSNNIRDGIECLTGIYVAVDAATTYVTILFYPGNEVAQP